MNKEELKTFIEKCNQPIKVKNPMDDAALICMKNDIEVYRIMGYGHDLRRVYPNGDIKY